METINIGYAAMLMLYALMVVPVLISVFLGLGTVKRILIAMIRMTVQLGAMGLYLDYLFRFNNAWVNIGWVLLMIAIANITVNRNTGLRTLRLFLTIMLGLTVSAFFVIIIFIFIAIRPEPFYDARYLIPISGMVVGNCMRANTIALERFFSSVRKNEKEFLTYLLMGATLREAALPYIREAVRPALAPQLATMATLGLVSLPGMMTGQILGGSTPIVAIKYQIGIMIAIFTAITLTTVLNLLMSLKIAFNDYSILRRDFFKQQYR
ncbi:MAG: ABC transporter permease [Spirochaetes bacterium DG_61]|nr:MAG: ABC transporter permease [Spirochaetes bacterium DG_61]